MVPCSQDAPKPALVKLLVRAALAEAERQERERAEAERVAALPKVRFVHLFSRLF